MERNNIIIFDFDCTLTEKHFYHFYHSIQGFFRLYNIPSEEHDQYKLMSQKLNTFNGSASDIELSSFIIDKIFGGTKRFNAILNMLNELNKNNTLIIASRGIQSEIIKCLNLVGIPLGLFGNIYDHTQPKDSLIYHHIAFFHNVFYIDDDHTEHKKFLKITNNPSVASVSGYENYTINGVNYVFYSDLVKDIGGGISIDLASNIVDKFKRDSTGSSSMSTTNTGSSTIPTTDTGSAIGSTTKSSFNYYGGSSAIRVEVPLVPNVMNILI